MYAVYVRKVQFTVAKTNGNKYNGDRNLATNEFPHHLGISDVQNVRPGLPTFHNHGAEAQF